MTSPKPQTPVPRKRKQVKKRLCVSSPALMDAGRNTSDEDDDYRPGQSNTRRAKRRRAGPRTPRTPRARRASPKPDGLQSVIQIFEEKHGRRVVQALIDEVGEFFVFYSRDLQYDLSPEDLNPECKAAWDQIWKKVAGRYPELTNSDELFEAWRCIKTDNDSLWAGKIHYLNGLNTTTQEASSARASPSPEPQDQTETGLEAVHPSSPESDSGLASDEAHSETSCDSPSSPKEILCVTPLSSRIPTSLGSNSLFVTPKGSSDAFRNYLQKLFSKISRCPNGEQNLINVRRSATNIVDKYCTQFHGQ
ncbi:hypothetical protein L596_019664 [Steinernema carpocapsae]|uniref:Uncharacterized protein n=1 Tax=Steinernema carpocapsae TaxID=34508 RepID=A0A4V6XVZ2_STECR|nr:hypothetical protein L596_019664 [Steinernema carpocapsae]